MSDYKKKKILGKLKYHCKKCVLTTIPGSRSVHLFLHTKLLRGYLPSNATVAQVKSTIPDLFEGKYSSVLYIGASYLRQHFLDDFVRMYDRVVVLEIDKKNAEYVRQKFDLPGVTVVCGDVRNTADLMDGEGMGRRRFDACFFYHGLEHLPKEDVADVLNTLESITDHIIVLGMPYGHYEQDSEYGNVYERHLWDIYPDDMHRLGYRTYTIGDVDDTSSNMIAWKHTGKKTSGLKK